MFVCCCCYCCCCMLPQGTALTACWAGREGVQTKLPTPAERDPSNQANALASECNPPQDSNHTCSWPPRDRNLWHGTTSAGQQRLDALAYSSLFDARQLSVGSATCCCMGLTCPGRPKLQLVLGNRSITPDTTAFYNIHASWCLQTSHAVKKVPGLCG